MSKARLLDDTSDSGAEQPNSDEFPSGLNVSIQSCDEADDVPSNQCYGSPKQISTHQNGLKCKPENETKPNSELRANAMNADTPQTEETDRYLTQPAQAVTCRYSPDDCRIHDIEVDERHYLELPESEDTQDHIQSQQNNVVYRQYCRRWFILAVVVVLNLSNGMVCNQLILIFFILFTVLSKRFEIIVAVSCGYCFMTHFVVCHITWHKDSNCYC